MDKKYFLKSMKPMIWALTWFG